MLTTTKQQIETGTAAGGELLGISFCFELNDHRNQQYSVTAITNSSAGVVERYAYQAYGEPTILDASASVLSSSSINNRYTYTGREWDGTIGLYHFRARWMSGLTGRFLSRDPIGFDSESLNYYQMVEGEPLNSCDPSGLASTRPIPRWSPPNAPPGGSQNQQHHLFPVAKENQINALCKALGFLIHEFTMFVQGDVSRGSEHCWYQYGCGNYNRKVQDILNRSNSCCDFMIDMVVLINNTQHCVARNMGLGSIPPITTTPYNGHHYFNNWPGGSTLIDLICSPKCKKPFPLPRVHVPPELPIPVIPMVPIPMPDVDPNLPGQPAFPGVIPPGHFPIPKPGVFPRILPLLRFLPRISPTLLPI